MKKELLTGLTVATVTLAASARPCAPGFGGHHGFHGGPRFHAAPHHFYGGFRPAPYFPAWRPAPYYPTWAGYYNYGYGVVAPTVVSSPIVYQQPVQQVVYQQPAQQVVYQQPAPQVVQQAPAVQAAPQPQEVRIVVEHQYPAQTAVQANQAQQQRVQ